MDSVVEKNLKKMRSGKVGGMECLLQLESVGGNADSFKGFSCAGLNFYYARNTGEIKHFGNLQDVPERIRRSYKKGIFRVAVNMGKMISDSLREKRKLSYLENLCVVEMHFNQEPSDRARQTLEETALEYNRTYGFQIP